MASPTSKSSSTSTATKTVKDKTFTGFGNLIRLLPTGTVFLYQFLNPVVTNNGHCKVVNKYLTGTLIVLAGISCFFSTFTDSYTDNDGNTSHVIATFKGVWPSPEQSSGVDFSKYKLRIGDFMHAILTLAVFGAVSLLDSNTVACLYPSFRSTQKVLMMTVPPVLGAISSAVFMYFPNVRHGIGYPSTGSSRT